MSLPGAGEARRQELAANLAAVQGRIAAACAAVGRVPAEVTLIAITKTWLHSDVRHLVELGVADLGENRDAEATEKAAVAAAAGLGGLRWHFVGQVQTNKARSVAGYADVVHSVDRSRLVRALSVGAVEAGRELGALIQVDLGPPGSAEGRGGATPSGVPALADEIAAADGLRLLGVMAVAPLGRPPAPAFEALAEVASKLREAHPGATWISAGMSGDLEVAVGAGATHVRVGSGLLGNRPVAR
ncbi:YggS family pyridoxal phosphate-dependent enzyme [Sporichthya sp.]|uniref:YggS family pyridoxal phosphate-dependent enzyme n=1 Tax=Sporichthya sp. TaxID=65475 RepID=UPI0018336DB4|nr:YggS family pyridoxal phosphate-dependent enzyme [Sporichthya sp.]MBA3744423.1 YggS family pyridoxal phosphate-dependent enzyme [Sporichthya sp.]